MSGIVKKQPGKIILQDEEGNQGNPDCKTREVSIMARRNGMMSDNLKAEIAKELGVYDTVKREGWGSVSSRDCGRIVQKAIEYAEKSMAGAQK